MLKINLKNFWVRVNRDPIQLVLLVFAAFYFIIYYVSDPTRPSLFLKNTNHLYLGWFTYFDQGSYLKLAHTLASFNFHQLHSTYTYGLGYPLVAVPAIWLGFDRDPFVFFNLAAFIFTIYTTYRVAKYFISPFAGFVAGFGLLFATPLISYVDIPWNSTVCLVAMCIILLVATINKIKIWHVLLIGFAVAWSFSARYVDAFPLSLLAIACVYRGSLKEMYKWVLYMIVGGIIILMPVLYSQYRIFGSPFRTPYVNHLGLGGVGGSDQGFSAYSPKRIPNSALGLFIGPRLTSATDPNDSSRGLLINFFWMLAAIPGAIIVLRKKNHRVFFGALAATGILSYLFYLSYRAGTPSALKYGALHYLKIYWPAIAILAAAFFDYIVKRTNLNSFLKTSVRRGRVSTKT